MAYPTKGIELVVPSNAETGCAGWHIGIRFCRRGHDYAVDFHASGLAIERDGQKVRSWDELPPNVQAIIRQAKGSYAHSLGA